jgi:membrane protease YdiL (CAAX protease family)
MKRNYGRTFGAGLVAILGFIGGLLINNALAALFPEKLALLANCVSTVGHIAVCLLGLYLASKIEGKSLRNYGIYWQRKTGLSLSYGLLVGLILFIGATLPLYLLGLYKLTAGNHSFYELMSSLVFFIAVGATEELFFRGFVQHQFMRFGPLKALLVGAAFFTLIHGLNPNVSGLALMNIFLAGCFFGLIMYASGSLLTAIGAHITWNWTQGAILGIPVSGTEKSGYFTTVVQPEASWLTGGSFGAEASLSVTVVLMVVVLGLLFYLNKSKKMRYYQENFNRSFLTNSQKPFL